MTVEVATTWTPAPERLGSAACNAAAVAARAWPMAMTSPCWRASLGSDSICARMADSSSVSSRNRLRAAQRSADRHRNLTRDAVRCSAAVDEEQILLLEVLEDPQHVGAVGGEARAHVIVDADGVRHGVEAGVELLHDRVAIGAEQQDVLRAEVLAALRFHRQVDENLAPEERGQLRHLLRERAERHDGKGEGCIDTGQTAGDQQIVAEVVDDDGDTRLPTEPVQRQRVGQQAVDADLHLRSDRLLG